MKLRTEIDNQKYNSIDLAKFICAVSVIMLHIAPFGETESGSVLSYINFGIQQYFTRLAVPFFFISSGFFLYRKTTHSSFSLYYSKKYMVRIIKLYIIWSIIYFPITLYGIIRSNNPLHSIVEYIRNMIFVGSHGQLWYLNGLIVAVCITSFLLYNKISPLKILCIAFLFYIIGLFEQSWFGLIAPIKDSVPLVWNTLKLISKVIVTTRNGFFFGFLFVSIGMVFAFYDIIISKSKSAILFIASMFIMLAEVYFLKSNDYIRGYDMYLFLVPSASFLFCLIKQINLPENKCYLVLRVMSSLMFYTHLWVGWIVSILIKRLAISTHNSPVEFIIVLFITLVVSYLIYALSNRKQFSFLKRLYT